MSSERAEPLERALYSRVASNSRRGRRRRRRQSVDLRLRNLISRGPYLCANKHTALSLAKSAPKPPEGRKRH